MGIGHSQRECSPLHHCEVPTHAGVIVEVSSIHNHLVRILVVSLMFKVEVRSGVRVMARFWARFPP